MTEEIQSISVCSSGSCCLQRDLLSALPHDYGYVVVVSLANNFVNHWMAVNVNRARKRYKVEYPDMYSDSKMFNCIQRAHQNTMEMQPVFLYMLFLGGLKHPRISAGAGVVFLLGRIQFARGYYTGDPDRRFSGAFGAFGMFTLMGCVTSLAVGLLRR